MTFRSIILLAVLYLSSGAASAQTSDLLKDLLGGAGGGLSVPQSGTGGGVEGLLEGLEILGQIVPGGQTGEVSRAAPQGDLLRAQSCSEPLSNPLIDGVVVSLLNQPITDLQGGETASVIPQFKIIMSLLPDDPCSLRVKLLFTAWMDALDGGAYSQAYEVTDALLPDLEQDRSAINLLGHLVRAVLLAFQQRNSEALAAFEALQEPVARTFGATSRLALTVQGSLNDVRLQRADEARDMNVAPFAQGGEVSASDDSPYHHLLADVLALKATSQAALDANDPYQCIVMIGEGEARLRIGEAAAALSLFDEALGVASQCRQFAKQSNFLAAWARHYMGLAHMHLGDLDAAGDALIAAQAQIETQRGPRSPLRLKNLRAQAELAALQNDPDSSLMHLSVAHDALEQWLGGQIRAVATRGQRRRIVALQSEQMDLALNLAIRFAEHAPLQEFAARTLLTFKGVQTEEDIAFERLMRSASDAKSRGLAEKIATLRTNFVTAEMGRLSGVPGAGDTSTRLAAALAQAEAEFSKANDLYRDQLNTRRVTLSDVRQDLAAKGMDLVEYKRIQNRDPGALRTGFEPHHWVAVVITAGEVRSIDLGKTTWVDKSIEQFQDPRFHLRLQIGDPDVGAQNRGSMAYLHASLIEPLGLTQDRVVLATDHNLGLVPFHGLIDSAGAHWPLDIGVAVSLTFSGRQLLAKSQSACRPGVLAVGGLEYDPAGKLEELVGTAKELEVLGALSRRSQLPFTALMGLAADKAALFDADLPCILHLATHGSLEHGSYSKWAADGLAPNNSGALDRPGAVAQLALSNANAPGNDGYLSALEAQSMALEGSKLVALGACDTALGVPEVGEGLHGFTRAFQIAGAQYVLAARYTVRDDLAQQFYETFYRHLFSTSDMDVAAAYRATLQELIANSDTTDWRAFTLYGI